MTSNDSDSISLWQMRTQAKAFLGYLPSLKELSFLLGQCQLSEKDQYTLAETAQFLATCQHYGAMDEELKSERFSHAFNIQLQNSAYQQSQKLGAEISQTMAMIDRQLSEMIPGLLQGQIDQLLATPGLLEEIIREAAKVFISAEKAGQSEAIQYQQWMDNKESILRLIYQRLKLKQGWCHPQRLHQ